jgi:hypothetical protein
MPSALLPQFLVQYSSFNLCVIGVLPFGELEGSGVDKKYFYEKFR